MWNMAYNYNDAWKYCGWIDEKDASIEKIVVMLNIQPDKPPVCSALSKFTEGEEFIKKTNKCLQKPARCAMMVSIAKCFNYSLAVRSSLLCQDSILKYEAPMSII